MIGFFRDVFGGSVDNSGSLVDSSSTASAFGIESGLTGPIRTERTTSAARAMSRRAARMKLDRILEKVEKR